MITLTAEINLLNERYLETNSLLAHNNISADLSKVMNAKSNGSNPFLFGVSKFSDKATFSNNVDYYISDFVSNKYKEFPSDLHFEIFSTGNKFDNFTIVFDKANNYYPTMVVVGLQTDIGYQFKPYYDNDPIYTIVLPQATDKVDIQIVNWNAENRPLVIQGIYAGVSIQIDKANQIAIESNIVDRSNFTKPSFGVISNRGRVEFNDLDKEIQDYIQQRLLVSGIKTQLYINNTLSNKKESIGVFNTGKWDYDNNNNVVSVELKDDLEEWQEINIKGFNYDPRHPEHKNFKYVYEYLYNLTPAKYNMQKFSDLDNATQNILENTYIKYLILNDCTLWSAWGKLCETLQLHIYKNSDGVTVCRYAGGN